MSSSRLIRMTYSLPDRLITVRNEQGKDVTARAPNHPKRAAYAHEINCWWEEAKNTNDLPREE